MPRSIVLLITANTGQARAIAQAMLQSSLPAPALVESGDAAILWLADQDCAAIVISNRLKGTDALETLARLRQRRPDLPVFLVSDANSELAAVAAFRLGVADYIPVRRGYEMYLAERLEQICQPWSAQTAMPSVDELAAELEIPPVLLQPTYQNKLRLVGRELDRSDGHGATLLEVPGGLLVRLLGASRRGAQTLEFADRDFLQLTRDAYGARQVTGTGSRYVSEVLPTGYEDFLRALGHWLDSRGSANIQVVELEDLVVVSGQYKIEASYQAHLKGFQLLLGPDDVKYLLDEAFRRRSNTPQRGRPFARLAGRKLA